MYLQDSRAINSLHCKEKLYLLCLASVACTDLVAIRYQQVTNLRHFSSLRLAHPVLSDWQ